MVEEDMGTREDNESAVEPQPSHHRHRRLKVKKTKKAKQLPELSTGNSQVSGAGSSALTQATRREIEDEEEKDGQVEDVALSGGSGLS